VFPLRGFNKRHNIFGTVEEVVEIHWLVALVTNACFTGTRVVAFLTAQLIMKAMAGESGEQMSIFKTRIFPVWVDHCGRGVIKFIVNVGRRIALIC
jgi:hypothetical protein